MRAEGGRVEKRGEKVYKKWKVEKWRRKKERRKVLIAVLSKREALS